MFPPVLPSWSLSPMTDTRRYSRVYWSVMDDERFADVWPNQSALGLWLQLLLLADASWPVRPNLPPPSDELTLLVQASLIIPVGRYQYRVRGMDDEKVRRQEHGRAAALHRWDAQGTAASSAQNMPSQSHSQSHNLDQNQGKRSTGRPKPNEHVGQHDNCLVCEPLREEWLRDL